MATQCDIGAVVHITFPIHGGVRLLITEGSFVLMVLQADTCDSLLKVMEGCRERLLLFVDHQTLAIAFRRIGRLM